MLKEAMQTRLQQYRNKLYSLAYERLQLQKKMEDIDVSIKQLEAAIVENEQASRDINTQEAIDKSKQEETSERTL